MTMNTPIRAVLTLLLLLAGWQAVVWLSQAAPYILPGPLLVAKSLVGHFGLILRHAGITVVEILLGLVFGTLLGAGGALALSWFPAARRWLLPLLVVAQAIPVFALAPILVLWLGYGLGSKVAMATLIIFFPVTASFLDGLRRTEPGWLDLARTMTAGHGAAHWAELRHIRLPAALPALASGLRVATAVAPIGAVVGEWVGSSAGLGYLMLHANGRMQIDLMFAALFVLAIIAVALFFTVDRLLRRLLPWQPDSLPNEEGDR
ncbi:MAG: ABC transporter permease [Alphaproteobacteria bacterium]|nr:ABC transporter permease [Alphaproteobacteria bacterium]MDP6814440.1 ABC transporter permease [Alphaproteobacteria bacterium]